MASSGGGAPPAAGGAHPNGSAAPQAYPYAASPPAAAAGSGASHQAGTAATLTAAPAGPTAATGAAHQQQQQPYPCMVPLAPAPHQQQQQQQQAGLLSAEMQQLHLQQQQHSRPTQAAAAGVGTPPRHYPSLADTHAPYPSYSGGSGALSGSAGARPVGVQHADSTASSARYGCGAGSFGAGSEASINSGGSSSLPGGQQQQQQQRTSSSSSRYYPPVIPPAPAAAASPPAGAARLSSSSGGGGSGSHAGMAAAAAAAGAAVVSSEPLPPYPKVPRLPVQPYTAAPEKVTHGYDLMVAIQQATNLPACDWWNGLADPYVIITSNAGGHELSYKTAHRRRTVNPNFEGEFFQLGNLPAGCTFFVEVWDKDVVTDDDLIGRASWAFNPTEMQAAAHAGGGLLGGDDSWGTLTVTLPLRHPSKAKKAAGDIQLEVTWRPSCTDQPTRMLGPCRFQQTLSPTAGVLTGHWWSSERSMPFSTYKLFLCNIAPIFQGVRMQWNRDYPKAAQIFKNPIALATVRTQHSALYSTMVGARRGGVLTCAAEFFELFQNGVRDGEQRFFTYVLCEDSFRCSETGAAFLNDMMSKHAMHSGAQEEVLYAGEFCIVPCPGAAGGHKLVVDNNSGTYAPRKAQLGLMAQLFRANFGDMAVETVAVGDPKLEYYQSRCPSRAAAPA